MIYLTLEQVIDLHDSAIQAYGGLQGIRDIGALISSLESPKMECFGEELYKGLSQKAAAYFFFIINNHPFNDGNKRSAFLASLVFLEMNGVSVELDGNQLEELAISSAKGELTITDIAVFFEQIAPTVPLP